MPAETTLYSLSDLAPAAPDSSAANAGEDRRGDGRLMTLYRVGSLVLADRRELCLIKNISAGGMMVRAYSPIAEGTRLSVELKCGEPIAGFVSWARDIQVGIQFDRPIDVIDVLAAPADRPRPRMPRIEVAALASVREGATTYRMKMCDVSQGGLKLQCDVPLPVGADVVVTLDGIEPRPGVVRWAHGDQMGITFNSMIALPSLVEWLRQRRACAATA